MCNDIRSCFKVLVCLVRCAAEKGRTPVFMQRVSGKKDGIFRLNEVK